MDNLAVLNPKSLIQSQTNTISFTPCIPTSESFRKSFNKLILSSLLPLNKNKGSNFSIASLEIPLVVNSNFTFSTPILSNLSRETVISISLSCSPTTSAIPIKTFLLLNSISKSLRPKSEKTASYS